MKRPRLNMFILEKNYEDIQKCLKDNKIFICQFEQGTCVFVDKEYNFIMYNPHSEQITRTQINKEGLLHIFNNVLMADPDYKFFEIETDGHSIDELFVGATEALMCLKSDSNFGDYRVRKLH